MYNQLVIIEKIAVTKHAPGLAQDLLLVLFIEVGQVVNKLGCVSTCWNAERKLELKRLDQLVS